jgi:hypothetical protein
MTMPSDDDGTVGDAPLMTCRACRMDGQPACQHCAATLPLPDLTSYVKQAGATDSETTPWSQQPKGSGQPQKRPQGSSGRRPVYTDTSAAGRSAFLGSLREPQTVPDMTSGGDVPSRLGAADRAVELTAEDKAEAVRALRLAITAATGDSDLNPRNLGADLGQASRTAVLGTSGRELSPETRSRYARMISCQEGWERATRAHEQAVRRRDALVVQYNELFEDPGPISGPWDIDDPIDRQRRP